MTPTTSNSASSSSQKYYISLPCSSRQVHILKAGDLVYLSGTIVTGRDHFHKRILSYQKSDKPLPALFDTVVGSALYHMGPIVQKQPEGDYKIISGGPTTSARMNAMQTSVAKKLGIHFIIGKGGMQEVAWDEIPAVYLQYPGGTGAIVSKFIKKVKAVEWLDLGTPEAAWFLDVQHFGPLVVAQDTHGNTIYSNKPEKPKTPN